MKTLLFITLCASISLAMPTSLSWNLLSENVEDLPLEVEYDSVGFWDEIWLRSVVRPKAAPKVFMEQGLGVKWVGMEPDDSGKPARVVLVYDEKAIIEVTKDKTRSGKIENGEKISWSDGSQTNL